MTKIQTWEVMSDGTLHTIRADLWKSVTHATLTFFLEGITVATFMEFTWFKVVDDQTTVFPNPQHTREALAKTSAFFEQMLSEGLSPLLKPDPVVVASLKTLVDSVLSLAEEQPTKQTISRETRKEMALETERWCQQNDRKPGFSTNTIDALYDQGYLVYPEEP